MLCVCEKAGVCMPQCVWEGPRTPQVSVFIFLLIYDNLLLHSYASWPLGFQQVCCPRYHLALGALGLQAHALSCLVWILEIWIQVLSLTWQTLYQLSHCLSLKWTFICLFWDVFTMQPWLAWYLLCGADQPPAHRGPPASASWVLRFKGVHDDAWPSKLFKMKDEV